MDESIKFFVGLDTHKDSIAVAVCEAGREASRFVGIMGPDVPGVLKMLRKYGPARQVSVVYEAGPMGYGLQRALSQHGYCCEVIAPSLVPRRPGERIKTDRRDCARLAELSRAGELKAIWVPDPAHEAMRNLWRAREDTVNLRLKARQQLKAFLLRQQRKRLAVPPLTAVGRRARVGSVSDRAASYAEAVRRCGCSDAWAGASARR
jgi:transposase